MDDEEEVDSMSFDVEIHEDVGAELEEFVRLNHSDNYRDAELLYRECLEEHLSWFPVVAEYADYLLRQRDFVTLHAFCKIKITRLTYQGKRDLLTLITIAAVLESKPEESFLTSLAEATSIRNSFDFNNRGGTPEDTQVCCPTFFDAKEDVTW